MDNEKIELVRDKYGIPLHYYGGAVRRLFMAGALIMLITLPFFNNKLPVETVGSLCGIIILSLAASSIAPRKKLFIILDPLISIGALLIFGYYAVVTYNTYGFFNPLFFINQVLAIIFLFASYYSSKTLRSLSSR